MYLTSNYLKLITELELLSGFLYVVPVFVAVKDVLVSGASNPPPRRN